MDSELNRYERAIEVLGDRIAEPAGRAFGRVLGRIWFKGECQTWAAPGARFVQALSIEESYERSFEKK